ncbi:MAG: hypothetical protein AAGA84_09790 [Pseudomonadota bacterium]
MTYRMNRRMLALHGGWMALSAVLWAANWILGAVIVALVGIGAVLAQPHWTGRRLVLKGTPVMLMFAIMFASASGMVSAVDQVQAWLSPQPAPPIEDCSLSGAGAPPTVGRYMD